MSWDVQIVGDNIDLEALSRTFDDDPAIVRLADGWVLRASEFDGVADHSGVRARAREILEAISGAGRLTINLRGPLHAGSLIQHRDDGTTNTVLSVDSARIEIRGGVVSLKVTRADGTVEERHPADAALPWVKVALKDDVVGRVLRLRNHRDLGWVELYRILEVVEHDIGGSRHVDERWASQVALGTFKHTANSRLAVGDMARHGVDRTNPPARPMLLSEARALIDRIVSHWLELKARQADTAS